MSKKLITTKQVLARAHISASYFREQVKALGIKPAGKVSTGKRGRPMFRWYSSVVTKLA